MLAGDRPDPAVIKVGDEYWMTYSSFEAAPGLLLYRSTDLVNWTYETAALPNPVGNTFAVDIAEHDGRFFIYIPFIPTPWSTLTDASIFVIHAAAMSGPWSEPIDLGIRGVIDPGHVVGEDGTRYLFTSGVRRIQLADDGLSTVGELEKVYDGWRYPDEWITEAYALEGPKLFSRAGRLVLPRQRRRRHRRPADRAHGDRRALAVGARTVGEPPAQPDRPHRGRGRGVVVARARDAVGPGSRTGSGGPDADDVVDDLARLRERVPHPRPADPARADPVGRGRLARGGRPRHRRTARGARRRRRPDPAAGHRRRLLAARTRQALDLPRSRAAARPSACASRTAWCCAARAPRPPTRHRSRCSPATTRTRSRSTSTVEPGVEAGLLLFFNNRLFCGMGIDGERMLSYSGGIRTHWREPAPATDRITLRIRNDEHIVTGWYRVPGGEWTRHAIRYETSGYHANTVGDLLSLRPALYAAGDGRGAVPRLPLPARCRPDDRHTRVEPGRKDIMTEHALPPRAVDPLDRAALRAAPRR